MKYYIFIFSFLILIMSCNCVIASDWNITWTPVSESIIDKEYIIDVQNLKNIKRNINISSFFAETSFDISELTDIEFFEWKLIPYTYAINYYNFINYSKWNASNKTWCNKTESILNYTEIIESKNLVWKACKSQLFIETGTTKENNYGFINIPKMGSKDTGNGTYNGTKHFLLKFRTPIKKIDNKYGSFGKVAILLDGVEYHPWWNMTWSNRKEIILTGNTSGAQTDYQVLLNVTYDSDMQSDFDDLRFCNETHELDSWLESKVDNSYALIWVEFPTTPSNGVNQTYYMYYGNVGATSDWGGGATFPFFDGFEDNDDSDWTEVYGGYHVPTSVEAKHGIYSEELQRDANGHAYIKKGTGTLTHVHAITLYVKKADFSGQANIMLYSGATQLTLIQHESTTNNFEYYAGGWNTIKTSQSSGQWHKLELNNFNFTANTMDIWLNDIKEVTGAAFRNTASDFDEIQIQESEINKHSFYDSIYIRKWAINPPTYVFGSEEYISYIPPTPTNLIYITGNFWVNHTWDVGSGNVTDSYNVSVNDVWYNTTTNTFYNDTYTAHAWQNITVYAFNTTGGGIFSVGNVSENTQIPNNPITIINTSDWTGNAGEIVYVDYDATEDLDSDVITFLCNRTDLFTDFNMTTGKGNWTATVNIYYVDFGVSDGHGSISNYTMTLKELSVKNGLLDEIKLIMSEITIGLKGISMSNYLVYAFILIGILLIILFIQILNNCIYRG